MFSWTEDNFVRAKKLYKQGVKASLIAEKIGTTRNAVLGKMYRNKLSKSKNKRRQVRHSYATHFKKYGESNCLLCNKTYTTYSKFDRFCSPCKSRDFYRNAIWHNVKSLILLHNKQRGNYEYIWINTLGDTD